MASEREPRCRPGTEQEESRGPVFGLGLGVEEAVLKLSKTHVGPVIGWGFLIGSQGWRNTSGKAAFKGTVRGSSVVSVGSSGMSCLDRFSRLERCVSIPPQATWSCSPLSRAAYQNFSPR